MEVYTYNSKEWRYASNLYLFPNILVLK